MEVFCVLLLDNVDSIVDGNDADKSAFHINNRQSKEIILVKQLSCKLLVIKGVERYGVSLHKIAYNILVIVEQKLLYGCNTDKLSGAVTDIAGVNCFLINTGTSYSFERILNRHILFEIYKLRCHNGAGRILRILKKGIDRLSHFAVGIFKNSLNYRSRHFLNNVYGVVDIKLIKDLLKLGIRKCVNKGFLGVAVKLNKGFGGLLLGQQPKQKQSLTRCNLIKHTRNISRIHLRKQAL